MDVIILTSWALLTLVTGTAVARFRVIFPLELMFVFGPLRNRLSIATHEANPVQQPIRV